MLPDRGEEPASGTTALDSLILHCAAALRIAEKRSDKFLCYMLAMTLQAARQRQPSAMLGNEQVG